MSVAAFLLAMLSKGSVAMLPVMLPTDRLVERTANHMG